MNARTKTYDLVIVGGGASGMMAAAVAGSLGQKVALLEKNSELGKKLKISGGGRCNITNATFDTRELLKKYGEAGKFLHSAFARFGVQDTFDYFENRGLPLVTEARQRVFPASQKALDVYRTLLQEIKKYNVDIYTDNPVYEIRADNKEKKITVVNSKQGLFTAKRYLIATGGVSHPETGSTGDGFAWLKLLGHTISEPNPNIVPLRVQDRWVKELSGTSLSFMKITFYSQNKKAFSKTGKILFTHFGLSGPLILNSAYDINELLEMGPVTATIDCYPDTDHASLDKKILNIFETNKNKFFKNVVADICPRGLADTTLNLPGAPRPDTPVHSISKEERKALVQGLKGLSLEVEGLMGMDRAVISDGGVPLSEVDTRTMQSKLYSNLYLTGDILHVNRPSGGYSLQLCWTTGYIAAQK